MIEQYKALAKEEVIEEADITKLNADKITYPVCIEYFEPLHAIVIALVNRDLLIYSIKHSGTKIDFPRMS